VSYRTNVKVPFYTPGQEKEAQLPCSSLQRDFLV